MESAEFYVVIVAGGTGRRMGGELPKQFLELNEKPIIIHSIQKFIDAIPEIRIVVAVHPYFLEHWKTLQEKYFPKKKMETVAGGETRFHSIKNALAAIPSTSKNAIVAVHDSVRPLVSTTLIKNCFQKAVEKKAVVPMISLRDSLRKVEAEKSTPVDRSDYRLVQTPQVFELQLLKDSYSRKYKKEFTDDASVVENNAYPIYEISGETWNLKITFPEDLLIAEQLLKSKTI